MKILEVLNEFYGDFEFIKEKWNEKYEGILIKIKEEQGVNVNLNMSKKFKIKMYILFICLLEKIFKSIRISSYFSYM